METQLSKMTVWDLSDEVTNTLFLLSRTLDTNDIWASPANAYLWPLKADAEASDAFMAITNEKQFVFRAQKLHGDEYKIWFSTIEKKSRDIFNIDEINLGTITLNKINTKESVCAAICQGISQDVGKKITPDDLLFVHHVGNGYICRDKQGEVMKNKPNINLNKTDLTKEDPIVKYDDPDIESG